MFTHWCHWVWWPLSHGASSAAWGFLLQQISPPTGERKYKNLSKAGKHDYRKKSCQNELPMPATLRTTSASWLRLWTKKHTAGAGRGRSSLSSRDRKPIAMCSNFHGLWRDVGHTFKHIHHAHAWNTDIKYMINDWGLKLHVTYRSLSLRHSNRSWISFS